MHGSDLLRFFSLNPNPGANFRSKFLAVDLPVLGDFNSVPESLLERIDIGEGSSLIGVAPSGVSVSTISPVTFRGETRTVAARGVVGAEGGVDGVSEESKKFERGLGAELGMKESVGGDLGVERGVEKGLPRGLPPGLELEDDKNELLLALLELDLC